MLREHVTSIQPGEEVDQEITKAIEENETVMYIRLLERASPVFIFISVVVLNQKELVS